MSQRPIALPGPEHYQHGTRARYVTGCRCADCRASNTRAYHERQARAKAAAAEHPAPAATGVRRTCAGVFGKACPKSTKLRKDSTGAICAECRMQLVWNGLVDAAKVRRHLQKLSRKGVGYKSVAAAADCGHTALIEISSGRKKQIRQLAARRILAVTADAVADHGIVAGKETWLLLNELIGRGFRRGELAKRLGMKMAALQIKHERVLARTAYAVAKLHRAIGAPPERCAAAAICDCTKPVVFELDAQHYCGKCDRIARPEGMTRALLAKGSSR